MLRLLLTALLFIESFKDVDSDSVQEANKALQDDSLTRALYYIESNPETLDELMSKNGELLEGDMISSNRNTVGNRWPTLEIPYVICPEIACRTYDILSAMAMVSEHTCLSFHMRTSETNYLLFRKSDGCASCVGFIGGEQSMFIGPLCSVGNIVHEILHSLGFYHEHTRTDRDQYITILVNNIIPGMELNFQKQQGTTSNFAYDMSSIMHYGRYFFSSNGLPTIVPKTEVTDMGQRVRMTKTDIEKVRHLYNCDIIEKARQQESSYENANMYWSTIQCLPSQP